MMWSVLFTSIMPLNVLSSLKLISGPLVVSQKLISDLVCVWNGNMSHKKLG